MTWYASQIYAQPTPAVRSILTTHPVLSKSLYFLNHLDNHQWPESIFYGGPHTLPPGGLLVGRELCAPDTREFKYHGTDAVSWEGIAGPADALVMRLSHLPSSSNGNIYFDSEWAGGHPPIPFLKFLKHLSRSTGSVISFYHHASGAEQSAQQELAWVFGETDYVYVRYTPTYDRVSRFTSTEVTEIPRTGHQTKTVLQLVMRHFGLELPTHYFAPHTRVFGWGRHKI
jgi:hypothetical protein